MRVFVGPREIAGLGMGWVQGLRAAGAAADLVCTFPHPFAYAGTTNPRRLHAVWAHAGRRRLSLGRGQPLSKALAIVLHQVVSWLVLLHALRCYDAFIFLFGETITNTAFELALLRWCGKRVMVVFLGSDARPPYIDGALFPSDQPFDAAAASAAAVRHRHRVRRLERGAHVVVNARATAQFLTRPFVNWFALGIPRVSQPTPVPPVHSTVRVLHSPSHPVLKGTAEVRAAIERLRARGVAVELQTIEGRPNAEVLQALRECHLVIDQLYSDTPMAAFATEAATLGRPVIVCGLAADRAAAQVQPMPLPPSVYVRPDDLEEALEELVHDSARRQMLGEAGARFVATHWHPQVVGERLLRVLRDDVAAQWWCHPHEVDHVAGCGLPEPVVRAHIAAVIRYGGVAALQVEDKPALERAFARYAGVPVL
jgi:hypothetical protein